MPLNRTYHTGTERRVELLPYLPADNFQIEPQTVPTPRVALHFPAVAPPSSPSCAFCSLPSQKNFPHRPLEARSSILAPSSRSGSPSVTRLFRSNFPQNMLPSSRLPHAAKAISHAQRPTWLSPAHTIRPPFRFFRFFDFLSLKHPFLPSLLKSRSRIPLTSQCMYIIPTSPWHKASQPSTPASSGDHTSSPSRIRKEKSASTLFFGLDLSHIPRV